MIISLIFALIAIVVITLQGTLTALPFIAPDFQPPVAGAAFSPTTVNYVFVAVLLCFAPTFFALTFIQAKKFWPYLLKAAGATLGSMALPSIILLGLSFYFNYLRCQASGFCVGGEPFDYMSTIFFVMSWIYFMGIFLLTTAVIISGFYFFKKLLNNSREVNTVLLITKGTLLIAAIGLLAFQSAKYPPSFTFDSPIQKAIKEAMAIPECPPYEHCGDEKMDIAALIASAETKEVPAELSHYQRWALSLGAMTVELNNLPYDKLSWAPPTMPSFVKSNLKQALKDSWDITDRATTLKTLDWLANEGHSLGQYQYFHLIIKNNPDLDGKTIFETAIKQAEADATVSGKELPKLTAAEKRAQIAALDSVIKNEPKTGDNLIYAWDYGRFVFVVQAAHTVGYLDEKEALLLIEEVGKRVKTRFHSWQEFGDNYVVGRLWWAPNQPGVINQTNQLYSGLTQPSGQWHKIPWEWSTE